MAKDDDQALNAAAAKALVHELPADEKRAAMTATKPGQTPRTCAT